MNKINMCTQHINKIQSNYKKKVKISISKVSSELLPTDNNIVVKEVRLPLLNLWNPYWR